MFLKPTTAPSYLQEVVLKFRFLLDKHAVFLEESAEKEGQVLDEILLVLFPVPVRVSDVRVQREHLRGNRVVCMSVLSVCLYVLTDLSCVMAKLNKTAYCSAYFSLACIAPVQGREGGREGRGDGR